MRLRLRAHRGQATPSRFIDETSADPRPIRRTGNQTKSSPPSREGTKC